MRKRRVGERAGVDERQWNEQRQWKEKERVGNRKKRKRYEIVKRIGKNWKEQEWEGWGTGKSKK